MLRIQQLRFHRRNSEEGSVEPVKNVEVEIGAKPAGFDLPRVVGEQGAHTTGAGPRNAFLHRVPAGFQETPEGVNAVRTGEPAGHADDRDSRAGFGNFLRPRFFESLRLVFRTALPVRISHRDALLVSGKTGFLHPVQQL